MNFPIWIIEIPHQRDASAWTCHTLNDLAEAGYAAASDDHVWADEPTADDFLEALAHDLSGLKVCETLADLVHTARRAGGHQSGRVQALAAGLLAEEFGLDHAATRVALDPALAPYEAVEHDDLRAAQDKLSALIAADDAEVAGRAAARAAREKSEAARKADYDARVTAWRASLDPSSLARLEGAESVIAGLSGKQRKRAKQKLRDVEKALGRPDWRA